VILAAIQKVEVVGGESWWSHNSGSLFIGIAAVVAASVAAYISIRNHREQLIHDREIRDRDATREAIDSAVEGISDCILRAATFSAQITSLESARDRLEESEPGAESDLRGAIDRALAAVEIDFPSVVAAVNTMFSNTIRLAIRLGDDHPITARHAETRNALGKQMRAVEEGRHENRSEAQKKAAEELVNDLQIARTAFESACYAWLNE
jgi:uncharacterized membrane protein